MKSKNDIKIKRKIGALIILGLFLAITLAMPTFGWSGSPDGWSLKLLYPGNPSMRHIDFSTALAQDQWD